METTISIGGSVDGMILNGDAPVLCGKIFINASAIACIPDNALIKLVYAYKQGYKHAKHQFYLPTRY